MQDKIVDYKDNLCCLMFISFITFICYSFLFILPIYEIYFGASYKRELYCNTNIMMLDTWLILKGCFDIIFILLTTTVVIASDKSLVFCLFAPIIYLVQFFNFAMLVLGTVIVLRDCSSIEPSSFLKISLYVILGLGYLSLFNRSYIHSYQNDKKKKRNTPMFDV
jgi:hypothetical protein